MALILQWMCLGQSSFRVMNFLHCVVSSVVPFFLLFCSLHSKENNNTGEESMMSSVQKDNFINITWKN